MQVEENRGSNEIVSSLTSRTTWIAHVALVAIALSACGSVPTHVAAKPSPTLSAYDLELLTQLKVIDFQAYETDVTIGAYIFGGAGLNYDRNTLELGYGGLAIDEWKAIDFNPAGGKCSTAGATYSWSCAFLANSPHGNRLYAGPRGGLPGYPADLGDVYVELGSTVVHLQRSGLHAPSLADLEMFADALKPATPDAVVGLNIKARDYALYLQTTVKSRIEFKTYLPQKPMQNFTLDHKSFGNPTDPLHPYLSLHFARVANGNEAFEFGVDEFRDDVPLDPDHCGPSNPEIGSIGERCMLSFTTPKGTAVYSTYSQTRFDFRPTRIVVWLSLTINRVSQQEMTDFIDSFTEVPAKDIA
jgi:hypothetical protein